jgi:DNA-binding response OmpR family regulator
MVMRVLLLEHIVGFAQSLVRKLPAEGFDVECLSSDVDIVRHATSGRYGLAMLDVCEPVFGTFEVLKQIRHRSSIPIILLTGRDDELDRIVGLELGADAFVHGLRVLSGDWSAVRLSPCAACSAARPH